MKADLDIKQIELGNLQNFIYLIGDRTSGEAVVVDPAEDTDAILRQAKLDGLTIKAILLTHGHHDHVGGVAELTASLKIPAYLSEHEAPFYTPVCRSLLRTKDHEKIKIGGTAVECLHTPGHTPGCQCFLANGNLFTGDTLFIDGVGRTDLPGGDAATLFESLQLIKKLPDETMIWPGHDYGAVTHQKLGDLKKDNPFLRCRSLQDFLDSWGS